MPGSRSEFFESYYTETSQRQDFPSFSDSQKQVENCIIGGGLAGLATGLGLVERGQEAVVLEAKRIGWGASGRNGGFLGSGYSQGSEILAKKLGLDHARKLHRETLQAQEILLARIEKFSINCGPVVRGSLDVSLWPKETEQESYCQYMNRNFGEAYCFWNRDKLRAHYKTKAYYGAVFDPRARHLHPLNLVQGLAGALVLCGGKIFEKSPVQEIRRDGSTFLLRCPRGMIRASRVILCASGYIGRLYPSIARATLPISTYVMVSEPLGDRLMEMTDLAHSVSDDRISCDYYRPLPDGSTRLLWGGRISAFPAKPEKIAPLIRQNMVRIYPQFSDVKIAGSWSGVMGYAAHKMPLIGEIEPGLWVNSCFGGHGLVSTTAGGEIVARALAGVDADYKLFAPFKPRYTGGWFGPLAAQCLYFGHSLHDALRMRFV